MTFHALRLHHGTRPFNNVCTYPHAFPLTLACTMLQIVIELPAGLMDKSDPDVGTTALRELREETGYAGRISSVTPVCFCDPGMSSATMALVCVDVDLDDDMNKSPKVGRQPCGSS